MYNILDIIILKEYNIDENDNIELKIKYFILRYRRIIGILLLIILIYLYINCNNNDNKKTGVIGGGNNEMDINNLKSIKKMKDNMGSYKKLKSNISTSIASVKNKMNNTKLGKKLTEIKGFKDAGFSRVEIGKKMSYQAGSFIGNSFKNFATWLYELLFAIAISIAICMIILPSVSFFIIGIICYFLLKSKISTFKSL